MKILWWMMKILWWMMKILWWMPKIVVDAEDYLLLHIITILANVSDQKMAKQLSEDQT